MDGYTSRLHRTWLGILLEGDFREVAALVVDADLRILYGNHDPYGICVDLPHSAYSYVIGNTALKQTIEKTLKIVCAGHVLDQNENEIENFRIEYRVKLLDVEENWREIVKELIVNAKDANQGVITEKVFGREKKPVQTYNEMKFGSQSEIRIAQELERRKVLFFPLPLAVRADTGVLYQDHREVDFLVCQDGVWGILEVARHEPERYEKDAEKDTWFKNSGILCIQHYTAENCYNNSTNVVDGFLKILARYKR